MTFSLCPQELVEPVISAYASGPHGSNVSPVIATLMQKCCPHGDIALKVREKACFGVLNISRNTWIDTNIREALVGSLAGLLNNANPQILRETVEALTLLSRYPKDRPLVLCCLHHAVLQLHG